ncbi:uncharacterized protein K02A2.6-like [Solenopsis invicta]|uniref:uncharacterized protein K02A2.6-like n=1 Tax=Solenopsis invicta TaxID=13686 RepID=UPI00193D2ECB|nr:uncharacterized protein K02A2.6-like [Solenopsis invicta]
MLDLSMDNIYSSLWTHTKFIEVAITPTISATRTVELCREVFSRYGPPEVLVSDHGTQFTSEIFSKFCKDMQISHIFTAVNPNGQAERMVDTVKRAIAKNPTGWRQELQDFLYSYRYTPCSATPDGRSPAELFFGRRISSPFSKLFPNTTKSYSPPPTVPSHKQLEIQEQFSQHHGAQERTFKPGDRTVVALNNKREQGYITAALSKTRYTIRLNNGKSIERHINHIWEGGSPLSSPSPAVSDDWMFYETQVDRNTPDVPTDPDHPVAPPEAPEAPEDLTEAISGITPTRPVRCRIQPKRLILDPKSKSYTQW